jgi:hypothetical protein
VSKQRALARAAPLERAHTRALVAVEAAHDLAPPDVVHRDCRIERGGEQQAEVRDVPTIGQWSQMT